MPWWRFGRDERDETRRRSSGATATGNDRARAQDDQGQVYIRDAERRSLRRLLQRRADLRYDLEQAESAARPSNPWTERIEQLDQALSQAERDLAAIAAPRHDVPATRLPPTPITIAEVKTSDPATVTLDAGPAHLAYREELDWAERGHQLALPELALVEGDVGPLVPDDLDPAERDAFSAHLRQSFSIIAEEVLERAAAGESLPSFTLADLTRPCERCGGWLDPKGRCPACAEMDRRRAQVQADIKRLTAERNDVRADLARYRERMPVIRRQLSETDADIARLEAKGVEPA